MQCRNHGINDNEMNDSQTRRKRKEVFNRTESLKRCCVYPLQVVCNWCELLNKGLHTWLPAEARKTIRNLHNNPKMTESTWINCYIGGVFSPAKHATFADCFLATADSS